MKKTRRWLWAMASAIFILVLSALFFVRPFAAEKLGPVLREACGERVNGTAAWSELSLTPAFDLEFSEISLTDSRGREIFRSPRVTVGWTIARAVSAWLGDKGVSAMIGDVVIDAPEIHARASTDGSWNVQNLLKPQEEETPSEFRGRVLLSGGAADVTLADGETFDFKDLDGKFSWLSDGKIDAALDGSFSGTAFGAKALYTDENNFTAEGKTGALALTALRPFLSLFPETAGLSLDGGTGEITAAKLWRSGGALTYHAEGRLSDAAAAYGEYTVTDASALFDIYDGGARLAGVRAKVNGEVFTGKLSVSWKEETAAEGSVSLHQVRLEKLLPGEDISGKLTGTLDFSGPVSKLSAWGGLYLSNADVKGVEIEKARADVSWDGERAAVSSLTATLPGGGYVEGNGTYDVSSGHFDGTLLARNASLDGLSAYGISGVVDGTAAAAGHFDGNTVTLSFLNAAGDGENLSYSGYSAGKLSGTASYDGSRFQGEFTGEALSGAGVTVDSAAGTAEGTTDAWRVDSLSGTVGDGYFTVSGGCADGKLDFKAQGAAIPIARFSALAGEDIGGNLAFNGRIGGTAEAPSFDFQVNAKDGYARGAEIRTLAGHVLSDGETLSLDGVKLETKTGEHTLSGSVGLSGEHALALSEKTEHTRIENILKLAGLDYPLTGWLDNTSEISGTLSNPTVTGQFLAWNGSAAGELYQSVSADYAFEDGTLRIGNGLASIYGGSAYVSGTVSADALDLELSLVDAEMDRIVRTAPVSGRATVRGHLSGTPSDPEFHGYAESRNISAASLSLERFSAEISYKDQAVELKNGDFYQKSGHFQWDGTVNAESGAVAGRLRFTDWDLGEALRQFDLPVKNIKGSMNGGMRLRGTLSDPSVDLRVRLNEGGSLGDTPMGEGRIELSYMNKALSLREFKLPVGEGLLAAKGTMAADGAMDMQLAANAMDLSWIPKAADLQNTEIGGKLTAGLSLHGTRESPAADISVTVENPSYNGITFDLISLMGNISDGAFRIGQALAEKDAYKVTAEGTVPAAALTRVPGEKDVPFDVDINLDNADLNALALWVKPVTSASGPIRGHVKVTGSWDDPEASGSVGVEQGSVTVANLSEPIEGIWGNLVFGGKTASFEGAAAIGGGSFSSAGMASWDKMKLSAYSGEAHLHAPSLNCVYYKGSIDADFTAGEERGLPKISGTVSAQNATVDIPMSFSESEGGVDFLMDVTATIGDKVRLYNSLLYDMTVRGNIHAMGLVSRPLMSGKVDVEKGTVRYLSNEFNVTEGTAIWGGIPDSFLPTVSVRANTSVGHYKVGMELTGPADGLRFKLSSEPSLNDTQIVTLLTLRQAPGSADSDETTGALFNAGLQMMFSGGVQELLKESFGLDLVSVTSTLTDYYDSSSGNMNDDYYYIKIGKYLFNDFMLTATTGINNSEQSFGFRYDLKSRVGLAAWYNNDHDSYMGADYQMRF